MTEHRSPYETEQPPQSPTPTPTDMTDTMAEINSHLERLDATMHESERAYLETIRGLLDAVAMGMDRLADARRWARAWKQAARANHDARLDAQLLAGEFAVTAMQKECIRCHDLAMEISFDLRNCDVATEASLAAERVAKEIVDEGH